MPSLDPMIGQPLLFLALLATAALQEPAARPVNYEDDVRPILEANCLDCHRGSRAKNGLALNTYAGIVQGGSSGPAIAPGNASASLLWQLVSREREPFMPKDADPLDDASLAKIRAWIDEGARETATSEVRVSPSRALSRLAEIPASTGVAVFPEGLREEPFLWSERSDAVIALAASPTAPLLAVGLRGEIAFVQRDAHAARSLAFPEGRVHALTFSRDGALLVAGGGRDAASGRAVVFDVKSGERVAEVGAEPDVVLACDLSSDRALLALGGPDGVLHVHDLRSGSELYTAREHTDWITALSFSPDGVLLATADRAGLVLVREAWTGRVFHELPAQGGRVNALAWRADSLVLTTATEQARLREYEMEGGAEIGTWNAPGAVLAITSLADGRIVSAGRASAARIFDASGKELAALETGNGPLTSVAARPDGSCIVAGGYDGKLSFFDNGALRSSIPAAPPTLLERAVTAKRAEIAAAETQRAGLAETRASLAAERAALETRRNVASSALAELEPSIASAEARLGSLQASTDEGARELARAEAYGHDLDALFQACSAATAAANASAASADARRARDRALDGSAREGARRGRRSRRGPQRRRGRPRASSRRGCELDRARAPRRARGRRDARAASCSRGARMVRAHGPPERRSGACAGRARDGTSGARGGRRQTNFERGRDRGYREAETALVARGHDCDARESEIEVGLTRAREELTALQERWAAQREDIRARGGTLD
jgi:hypothetical protein